MWLNPILSFDEINKTNILEKVQLSIESLSIILNTLNKIKFDIYDEIQDQNVIRRKKKKKLVNF